MKPGGEDVTASTKCTSLSCKHSSVSRMSLDNKPYGNTHFRTVCWREEGGIICVVFFFLFLIFQGSMCTPSPTVFCCSASWAAAGKPDFAPCGAALQLSPEAVEGARASVSLVRPGLVPTCRRQCPCRTGSPARSAGKPGPADSARP